MEPQGPTGTRPFSPASLAIAAPRKRLIRRQIFLAVRLADARGAEVDLEKAGSRHHRKMITLFGLLGSFEAEKAS